MSLSLSYFEKFTIQVFRESLRVFFQNNIHLFSVLNIILAKPKTLNVEKHVGKKGKIKSNKIVKKKQKTKTKQRRMIIQTD